MLRCVDWLPTGLHYVTELAFFYSQGSALGMPVGDFPNAADIAVTRVLHTGRVCPESMCLFLFPILLDQD